MDSYKRSPRSLSDLIAQDDMVVYLRHLLDEIRAVRTELEQLRGYTMGYYYDDHILPANKLYHEETIRSKLTETYGVIVYSVPVRCQVRIGNATIPLSLGQSLERRIYGLDRVHITTYSTVDEGNIVVSFFGRW